MKLGINIVGVLVALIGIGWFFQGIGVIPVGFMANDSKWAIIGIVCVLIAVGLLIYNNRRKVQV